MVIRRARTVGAPMQGMPCGVYNYTQQCIVIHQYVCGVVYVLLYILLYSYTLLLLCVCMCVLLYYYYYVYVCMYVSLCVCVLSLSYCVRARVCLRARIGVLAARLLFLLLLALCALYLCYPRSHSCEVVLTLFVVSRLRKIYCCYYSCKEAALLYCCLCECVGFSVSYCIHLIYCGSEIGSLDDCLAADVCECECCLCHCYYLSFC